MTEQRIDLGLTSTSPAGGGCGAACACGHGTAASPTSSEDSAAGVLRVEGMTCEHCVRAVTEELNALEGVQVVDIDLRVGGTSLVRIAGEADDDALAAAIDEAGYTLVR